MSLEEALAKNTAAVEALTAALAKGVPAAATAAAAPASDASTGKGKGKAAAAPAAPKIDRSEVNAALEGVKEKAGVEKAKAIIAEAGKAAKRADIAEENFAAVLAACKAVMDAGDEGGDDL